MTFKKVLRQVVEWLREDGRVSNRALKRQFDVGDDYLEDVKEALLYSHAENICDDGQGLIWSGEPSESFQDVQPETDKETRFQVMLRAVMWLLQRETRATYRELQYALGLDGGPPVATGSPIWTSGTSAFGFACDCFHTP